jgi:cadmium resistance protein CadD (predicted permease)
MSNEKRNILTGGMILITLGVLIYLSKAGFYSFGQTWPVLIIVIGCCAIIQRFKDFGGWFITVAGGVFLANEFFGIELSKYSQYILPAVLILLGIFVLLRRRKHK